MKKIATNIMLVWGAVFMSWMLLTEGGDMSLEMLLFITVSPSNLLFWAALWQLDNYFFFTRMPDFH